MLPRLAGNPLPGVKKPVLSGFHRVKRYGSKLLVSVLYDTHFSFMLTLIDCDYMDSPTLCCRILLGRSDKRRRRCWPAAKDWNPTATTERDSGVAGSLSPETEPLARAEDEGILLHSSRSVRTGSTRVAR